MPISLDTFRNLAKAGGTRQVIVDEQAGPAGDALKTRHSFLKWAVSITRGHETVAKQKAVAEAFMASLQASSENLDAVGAGLGERLKPELSRVTQDALNTIRARLSQQLDGTRALTTGDIEQALRLLSEAQAEAVTSLRAERPADIISNAEALVGRLRQAAADLLTPRDPDEPHAGEWLGALASGAAIPPERLEEVQDCLKPIHDALVAGDVALKELKTVKPQTAEGRSALNTLVAELTQARSHLEDAWKVMDWFTETYEKAPRLWERMASVTLTKGNGEEVTGSANAYELIADFQAGRTISEPDLQFLTAWTRSPKLASDALRIHTLVDGDNRMRVLENAIASYGEANWKALAGGGAMTLDPELLDGKGGHSETPYRDQVSLSLWDRRNEIIGLIQTQRQMAAQIGVILKAQGRPDQVEPGHVDPFRTRQESPDGALHEPQPDAKPGRGGLSKRADFSINPVGSETQEYHRPVGSDEDAPPTGVHLSDLQKKEHKVYRQLLNEVKGLTPEGQLPEGKEATPRHQQREVSIDPEVSPRRSEPGIGKGAFKAYDDAQDSGREEAARPLNPRQPPQA